MAKEVFFLYPGTMLILAIETSCDETSLALVGARGGLRAPHFKIIKHLIASQIEIHRPWGGVVPNFAKREHLANLPILFKKLLLSRSYILNPDIIAITVGPGLEPCLWAGINFAEQIKKDNFPKAKIVGVNHLHGHLYSFLLTPPLALSKIFPAVQLLVSGGHTMLAYMKSLTEYKLLGETRDDAAGECFDKVARMLNLLYPGGPEIEKLAASPQSTLYNLQPIQFPRPMLRDKSYDFSFSGLKTAVLYYLRDKKLTPELKTAVAHEFQNAVIDVLTAKILHAAKAHDAKSIILSGGVAANQALRNELRKASKKIGAQFISAPKKFQGDNAAMIAVAGHITRLTKKSCPLKADGALQI